MLLAGPVGGHAQSRPDPQAQASALLVQARDNLVLARGDLEGSHYAGVEQDLSVAAKALGRYAGTNNPHAGEAKAMQAEIQAADHDIAAHHEGLLSKINGWWNTASQWSEAGPAKLH
jgi:hypothetical protein